MASWMTSKKTHPTNFSHINNVVVDSKFEGLFANELERVCKSGKLLSWVKNDHLGFKIWYLYKGEIKAYYPDFILRFNNDKYLIVETKGRKKDIDDYKWNAITQWVQSINNIGSYGVWKFLTIFNKDEFNKIDEMK